ncbi:D-amino-acid transaminase [Arenibaculum pallidiluteum]|uniref:D-amino-acid transaminase n=1 Tax=Arenibaculum pallidiluteum TaxID=2812559 RepID=UPI001A975E7F|nr:D-amino-acid transaminase [Arenibaculum pallidiluteum]
MSRIAYVNGRYLPHAEARVHIEDRGFQFADGVYEVVAVMAGRLVDEAGHLDRLERSLRELSIAEPVSRRVLQLVMRELIRRNRIRDGIVYMQVTRGTAARDFRFPKGVRPTLVLTAKRLANFGTPEAVASGVAVVSMPDIRWLRRDIKSVALLAQALGKQRAAEAGAYEGWQVAEDGTVTEGCSSNSWIVTGKGTLVTREPSTMILNGVTRLSLLRLARGMGIPVEERPFTIAEAQGAAEAFMSAATALVLPVTRIDGAAVGSGRPGPVTLRLREAYLAYANAEGAS